MAITKYAGDRYVGLSSDTKPTNVLDGAVFFETDTLKQFILVSGDWEEISGGGGISAPEIINKTDNYSVLKTDAGNIFTMTSSSSKSFTLPSVTSSDIGLSFTFIKRGTGNLVIQAGETEKIMDSELGGTLTNNDPEDLFSSITVILIAETQWIIKDATGGYWITDLE